MLHQISFESSYFENGDTPKMQKIEWGFISQILGANFSKSANTKSFLRLLRIGRSELQSFQENFIEICRPDFPIRGLDFFGENFWPPITRKRYEIGPPCLGCRLRPLVSTIYVEKEAEKLREKIFFSKIFFFGPPFFPQTMTLKSCNFGGC
jgi:hypothetical protein